jgi:hypothetical protein
LSGRSIEFITRESTDPKSNPAMLTPTNLTLLEGDEVVPGPEELEVGVAVPGKPYRKAITKSG